MLNIGAILGLLFFILGCQHEPTRVTNQSPIFVQDLSVEKLMQGQPVILDTRPAFDFHLSHVPGAINVHWEDFSQRNFKSRGLLQNDLFAIARRFALMGIDPDTKVIILGEGPNGDGDEGRVAWTLKVLGVKNIFTMKHTVVRELNTTKEEPAQRNKNIWKPSVNMGLVVDLQEFARNSTNQAGATVLDVRPLDAFQTQFLNQRKSIQAKLIHIPWKMFFDSKGIPNPAAIQSLAQNGVDKNTTVYVIGNHGVESGAVTFAMNLFGYGDVKNFAGGYVQWK